MGLDYLYLVCGLLEIQWFNVKSPGFFSLKLNSVLTRLGTSVKFPNLHAIHILCKPLRGLRLLKKPKSSTQCSIWHLREWLELLIIFIFSKVIYFFIYLYHDLYLEMQNLCIDQGQVKSEK